MSFGKLKKLKNSKLLVVGLPNPNSVSKEEFERRKQQLQELNRKLKQK